PTLQPCGLARRSRPPTRSRFHCSATIRDPHPFPTRRSSDLYQVDRGIGIKAHHVSAPVTTHLGELSTERGAAATGPGVHSDPVAIRTVIAELGRGHRGKEHLEPGVHCATATDIHVDGVAFASLYLNGLEDSLLVEIRCVDCGGTRIKGPGGPRGADVQYSPLCYILRAIKLAPNDQVAGIGVRLFPDQFLGAAGGSAPSSNGNVRNGIGSSVREEYLFLGLALVFPIPDVPFGHDEIGVT